MNEYRVVFRSTKIEEPDIKIMVQAKSFTHAEFRAEDRKLEEVPVGVNANHYYIKRIALRDTELTL